MTTDDDDIATALNVLAIRHARPTAEELARVDRRIKATHPTDGLGEWNAADDVDPPLPRGWLLGISFCRRFVSSVLAEGATGKTALRVLQALALATGRALTGEHVHERVPVLMISFEDDQEELRRRILAACLHHNIARADLDGWLYLATPPAEMGKLMTFDARKGVVSVGELAARLEKTIVRRKIGLVICDPLIKAHAVSENDNAAMDALMQLVSNIGIRRDVAIDVPHHTSKGFADPGNANRGRGASAVSNAMRLVYTLSAMNPDEAAHFNIAEQDRRDYVRLDKAKLNIARTAGAATWFKLVSVNIGNATAKYPAGDSVQTLELWKPPDAWTGTSTAGLNLILDQIARGLVDDDGRPTGQRYSNAPNAGERSVWLVVQRVYPEKAEGQCREIIHRWLDTGLLYPRDYDDPVQRKSRRGLYVDDSKRPT